MTIARELFLRELATELQASGFERPQTILRFEDDRIGTDLAVAYGVGELTCIRAEPAHREVLSPLASEDCAASFGDLRTWAAGAGWEEVDGGDIHVLEDDALVEVAARGLMTLATLESDRPADIERVRNLLDANHPDDVDEAELSADDLDPRLVGVVDAGDSLVAIAASAPWRVGSEFEDIGVLVDSSVRRTGVGRLAVRGLCLAISADGRRPLYRCNWSREPSKRLAVGLGFERVATLIAFRPRSRA